MDRNKITLAVSFIITALSSIGNLVLDLISKLPG